LNLKDLFSHRQGSRQINRGSALVEAVLRPDIPAVKEAIASGADLNELDSCYRITPLLWAIFRGDIEAVRLLSESGADPNVRPNPADSPLWHAEDDFGLTDIAELLKAYGAKK
jgi:ankyrin repeat protein